jgi:hypothetical protein
MSRRTGEFEHRTSIFEGAFRAWSHFGGLKPADLEIQTAAESGPLSDYSFRSAGGDPRVASSKGKQQDTAAQTTTTTMNTHSDGSALSRQRTFTYEPLLRHGLDHPYVRAILSAWLSPQNGDKNDPPELPSGHDTLRTWWQHRRKGQSGSALRALANEKMQSVLDGYTRHFFAYAHCIVVHDKVQPPRGLHSTMKEWQKQQQQKKTAPMTTLITQVDYSLDAVQADLSTPNLTPSEKMHIVQRRIQESSTGSICQRRLCRFQWSTWASARLAILIFFRAFWRPFDAAMPLGLYTAVAVVPPKRRRLVTWRRAAVQEACSKRGRNKNNSHQHKATATETPTRRRSSMRAAAAPICRSPYGRRYCLCSLCPGGRGGSARMQWVQVIDQRSAGRRHCSSRHCFYRPHQDRPGQQRPAHRL